MPALGYHQVHVSSRDENPAYPSPIDCYYMQNQRVSNALEWISAKSCSYPQEIGICLPHRSYVKTLRLTTFSAYAPSKVEIYTGDDDFVQEYFMHPERHSDDGSELPLHLYFSTECRALCTIEWREKKSEGNDEIRIDVHEPLNVLKLILQAPREFNVYNQIALIDVELVGVDIHDDHIVPASSVLSEKPSIGSIQQALLDTGVDVDIVSELGERPASIDEYTKKALANILLVKAYCIQQEEYDRVTVLTEHITKLSSLGQQMYQMSLLKTEAIQKEDYDTALQYHQAMEALHATREIALAAAFTDCQTPPEPPPAQAENIPSLLTILDLAIRTWCREDPPSPGKGATSPEKPRAALSKDNIHFLNKMFGGVFMEASLRLNWKVRRACVEIAEQHIAVFSSIFDIETLYEMYSVWLEIIVLPDKTIPVIMSGLHLIRTMYEKPGDSELSFGTYGLRRGLLRPRIQTIMKAILSFGSRYNTLLREECIRTVRYLAQQRHVAELVLDNTWQWTRENTVPFERVLGLKFIQDLLYTWIAFDIAMPADNAQLVREMILFMKECIDDANEDISGTALECLTLLQALEYHQDISVTLEVEAHIPLFRKFPFTSSELKMLISQAETYARLHELPMQLKTYLLDEASLEGFEKKLKKGSVTFVGSVEKRVVSNQEPPRAAFVGTVEPRKVPVELPAYQIIPPTPTLELSSFSTIPMDSPPKEEESVTQVQVLDQTPAIINVPAPSYIGDIAPDIEIKQEVVENLLQPPLTIEVVPAIVDEPLTNSTPVPIETVVLKPTESFKEPKFAKSNQVTPTTQETIEPQKAAVEKIETLKVIDEVVTKAKKGKKAQTEDDKKGCRIS